MTIHFTKMQGLGNDFVVLEALHQPVSLTPERVRWLADRHFGVGCDQVLIVEPAQDPDNDFRYRILNADGSEVENCGNGARCFVRFVHDRGLTHKPAIRVETLGGVIIPQLLEDGRVCVDMGKPVFEPALIPFLPQYAFTQEDPHGPLQVAATCTENLHPAWPPHYPSLAIGEAARRFSILSMGNPHAVQIVAHIEEAPVAFEGPLIERHPAFPKRVNAGFMQILDRQHIRLRVFERGAGETLACGTGACAAVVAGIHAGLLAPQVQVQTQGGILSIRWEGAGTSVRMTGEAVSVFSGQLEWPPALSF